MVCVAGGGGGEHHRGPRGAWGGGAASFVFVPRARAAVSFTLGGSICATYELPAAARASCVFTAAALSPSGRWLYALTDDARLWAWDVVTGVVGGGGVEEATHDSAPLGLVAHPTRSGLVTWAEDATLRTWAPNL